MSDPSGAESHERWHEEVAAYLLGSLDERETAKLEGHLADCAQCRERLHWLRPAAELIPESVELVQPPPELRERILAEVRSEEAVRARTGGAGEPARRGWRGWLLRPAVGLAGAAVIAAGIAGYQVGTDGGDPAQTIQGPSSGKVMASLERKGDSGTLQLAGLTPLGSDEVYQAWVQRDGGMEPSSLFAPRANGSASAAIPKHLDGARAVLVTIEPRGGSEEPTSAPLVSVPLD